MSYFKNTPQVHPEQDPMEPATPAPTPEVTPKRRRFVQPTFTTPPVVRAGGPMRMAFTSAFVALMFSAQAQTDNTAKPQPDQAGTSTQQGWVMFNDQMGKDLNIPADQLQRLREVDARYAAEYRALGADPTKHPNYGTLTERRGNDIRGIVSAETYGRWDKRYGGSMTDERNKPHPDGTAPKSNTATPGKGTHSGGETNPPKTKTTP